MRLFALLLSLSLVLADDQHGTEITKMLDLCDSHDKKVEIIQKEDNLKANSGIYGFSRTDISCFINKSILKCSLSTHTLPKDANYSASLILCGEETTSYLDCVSHSTEERVECSGPITDDLFMVVQINISVPDNWYCIYLKHNQQDLKKFDRPQNITTSVKSTNLEIQWLQPDINSLTPDQIHCFEYQLKINDEVVEVNGFAYNKTNFDPTRAYIIQLRTQLRKLCSNSIHWSDWSEAVVVGESEKTFQLNVIVIVSLAFLLPMILLAFLLTCKFQRVSEKLFPSIPTPSKNIKILFEKEDFCQVPPKHACEDTESTEILQVTS